MEFENVEIGTEQPPLEPKRVLVLDIEERTVKDTADKEVGVKLVLKVKHPDNPEMEISKVKFEKNKKLKESGLWLSKDKDGKIPFNSALAFLLRKYGCVITTDLKNKEIDTVIDENGFIIAKAY